MLSLARVIMVFTYVRCCTQLCRWTSSFVSPLLVCTSQCPGFVDVIVTPGLLVYTCKKSHVHLFIVTYSHTCVRTSQFPGFVYAIFTPGLFVSTCKKSHVHLFILTYSHMCPYVPMPRLCGCHLYNRAPGFHVQEITCTFIYCNVLTHVSVRHNAPALWMSSLHQSLAHIYLL